MESWDEGDEVQISAGTHAGKVGVIVAVNPKTCRISCKGEITGNVRHENITLKKKVKKDKKKAAVQESSDDESASYTSADTMPPIVEESSLPVIPLSFPHAFYICERLNVLVDQEKQVIKAGRVPAETTTVLVRKILDEVAASIDNRLRKEHVLAPYLEQDPSNPDFCRIKCIKKDGIQYSAMQIDHVLPQAWGGADALHNYVIMPTDVNRELSDDMTEKKRDLITRSCREAWSSARAFAKAVCKCKRV